MPIRSFGNSGGRLVHRQRGDVVGGSKRIAALGMRREFFVNRLLDQRRRLEGGGWWRRCCTWNVLDAGRYFGVCAGGESICQRRTELGDALAMTGFGGVEALCQSLQVLADLGHA